MFHRRASTAARRTTKGELQTQRRSVVIASATLVNRKQIRRSTRKQSWQEECWAFFDTIGELHYATRWIGNALSRIRLHIAKADDNEDGADPVPADSPPESASSALQELFAGDVGQGEMMRRVGTNLDIVGEAFLVRLPSSLDPDADKESPEYRWVVGSIDEFAHNGGRSRLKLPETGESVDLDPEQVTIIRLWNPHPRQASEADSAVRANLPVLREVQSLSQHITATVESRLAGAGVLAIPKSATLPNPNIQEGANPLHQNAFVDALVQGMVTPISDRDNASAVVPIVLSVDDEAIGKLQHLTFSTELDANVTTMRQDALARFAAGVDLPQEIITGLGDSSHWNASELEEQAIKVAIEPIAGVICDALTQQYLWPAMRAMGESEPEKWVIWYSASELTQRPDRSEEAQVLYDKGVISPDALRRENGFNADDAPSDEDRRTEFARQVVLEKPELMSVLAPYVGFDETLGAEIQEAMKPPPEPGAEDDPNAPDGGSGTGDGGSGGAGGSSGGSGSGSSRTPRRSSADSSPKPAQKSSSSGGTQSNKTTPVSASATRLDDEDDAVWQFAAVELVALRALEMAGKRLLTNSSRGLRGRPEAQAVHTYDLHTVVDRTPQNLDRLLDKAFDLANPVLGEQPCIRHAVDTYCRALITSGTPHRRDYLIEALRHAGCLADAS